MSVQYQLTLPIGEHQETGTLPIDSQFDSDFANEIARFESYNKHLYRPNTYLHKWWARRCGTTFRLILKQLVQEETMRAYYAPGGLEGKIILDPMMGGGTTIHEAIRLGANVVGADIDPIPVLQARASLADIPLRDLENAFRTLYSSLDQRIGDLFRTTCPHGGRADLRYVLYGAMRRCPCGLAISVDSTVLRHNSDGSVIHICPSCHDIIQDEELCNCTRAEASKPKIVEKDVKVCPECGNEYEYEVNTPFYARYVPLAVVGECPEHGLFFKSPSDEDLDCINRANDLRNEVDFDRSQFEVIPGPKSVDLIRRGVANYLELFSSRQLLYLDSAAKILSSFKPLVRLKLSLLVSTSLEFNSMLCGYKGGNKRRPGAVRHTFSHHAYSFPHTALENNPLFPEKSSGTLRNLFHYRIRRARQWALAPEERKIEDGKTKKVTVQGEIDVGVEVHKFERLREGSRRFLLLQGSSASLDLDEDTIDFVITDPPYFDSVQYSDLAAFFRVWLRHLLPTDVNWEYDHSKSAVDPQANGNGQYRRVLTSIFSECHRVLKRSGRLVFTFHHWNPKGWAAVTSALKDAGFVLLNRYVVHSENPISVHISNLNALKHDAILVLSPTKIDAAKDWELPGKIDTSSSEDFCRDCATALGWMLSSSPTSSEIEGIWSHLLEG
jgi:adenine-specific DNA methylase